MQILLQVVPPHLQSLLTHEAAMQPLRRYGVPVLMLGLVACGGGSDTPEYAVEQLIQGIQAKDQLLTAAYLDPMHLSGDDRSTLDLFTGGAKVREARTVEDAATVSVDVVFPDLDTTLVMNLRLARSGEQWKVTGTENSHELYATLQEVKNHRLEEVNRTIQQQLRQAIELGPLEMTDVMGGAVGYRIGLTLPVSNRTDRPIRSLSIVARVPDVFGARFHHTDSVLAPGATTTLTAETGVERSWELGLSGTSEAVLQSLHAAALEADFLVFADNAQRDTLQIFRGWGPHIERQQRSQGAQ